MAIFTNNSPEVIRQQQIQADKSVINLSKALGELQELLLDKTVALTLPASKLFKQDWTQENLFDCTKGSMPVLTLLDSISNQTLGL